MQAPGRLFPGASAQCAAPGPIPFKQEAAAGAGGVGASALGVLLVLLAAAGAVLYLRKRLRLPLPGGAGERLVRVLESERMGPRTLLCVVEFGGQRHLLAQGEHGVSCVASVPAPGHDKEPA